MGLIDDIRQRDAQRANITEAIASEAGKNVNVSAETGGSSFSKEFEKTLVAPFTQAGMAYDKLTGNDEDLQESGNMLVSDLGIDFSGRANT